MKNFFRYLFLVILSLILYSCFSEKYEYVGEKKVINKDNWKIKIYQLDEFETLTPVEYEIVNERDSLVTGRHGLMGADANLQNVDRYYAKIQDSIFYICYPYPKVMAIKHISNINGSNQWSLIENLKKRDTSLYLDSSYIFYKRIETKGD